MKVSIHSLKNGLNSFEFEPELHGLNANEREFDLKEIKVVSNVDKSEHNIVVSSEVKCRAILTCDSCLDSFVYNIEDSFTILYTSEKSTVDDEMVRMLDAGAGQIDLTVGLRESVLLALPMQFRCREDCRGLCPHCGANLNKESCQCKEESIDSRWEGLRKLLKEDAGTN